MKRAVVLAVTLTACGGGRILSGPVVGAAGITAEPRVARLDQGVLEILLEVDNRTDDEIRIEPTGAGLVGPDGTIYPESGGARWYALAGHSHRRIRVKFADLDWKLEHAPGFYLRLDGFIITDTAVAMPPLPLGHPVADADGKVRVRRVISAPAAAPTDATCAVLPVGDDAITAAVRQRLEAAGWTVVETESQLSAQASAQAAGCRSGDCVRELGGALGVAYLIAGSVAEVDGDKAVTLRLMRVADGEVTARANALILIGADGDSSALDQAVGTLVGLD